MNNELSAQNLTNPHASAACRAAQWWAQQLAEQQEKQLYGYFVGPTEIAKFKKDLQQGILSDLESDPHRPVIVACGSARLSAALKAAGLDPNFSFQFPGDPSGKELTMTVTAGQVAVTKGTEQEFMLI